MTKEIANLRSWQADRRLTLRFARNEHRHGVSSGNSRRAAYARQLAAETIADLRTIRGLLIERGESP